ncbi:MAG: type VI secretion system baseplate subunit TssG [Planctomycetota bacterium]|jgi:type VI secretion system protein ImpH
MASPSGRDRAPLSGELWEETFRFDFFQAVRLLERIAQEQSPEDHRRKRQPVGYDHAPGQEVVRFRALPSHSFPPGSVTSLRSPKETEDDDPDDRPPEMTVSFMGLTGPTGVLPRHYTSLVIERARDKDFTLRDFLDLFHHRTVSLFYRAWRKYRFAVGYERAQLAGPDAEEDLLTWALYCLVGLGTGGLRGRMRVDDEAYLFFAGHFARHPRSAVALERMIADYFNMPTQLKQFRGQWLYLSRDDQSALPQPEFPEGLNNQLGLSVVVGERVWDVESKFRVRLGPLPYRQFREFFPTGGALLPLCQLARSYVGPQFDFDVQPVLIADEVPRCILGGDGPDAAHLGWNTWVRSGSFDHDVDDALFSLQSPF